MRERLVNLDVSFSADFEFVRGDEERYDPTGNGVKAINEQSNIRSLFGLLGPHLLLQLGWLRKTDKK